MVEKETHMLMRHLQGTEEKETREKESRELEDESEEVREREGEGFEAGSDQGSNGKASML